MSNPSKNHNKMLRHTLKPGSRDCENTIMHPNPNMYTLNNYQQNVEKQPRNSTPRNSLSYKASNSRSKKILRKQISEQEEKIKSLILQNSQLRKQIVELKVCQFYQLDDKKLKELLIQVEHVKKQLKKCQQQIQDLQLQNDFLKRSNNELRSRLQRSSAGKTLCLSNNKNLKANNVLKNINSDSQQHQQLKQSQRQEQIQMQRQRYIPQQRHSQSRQQQLQQEHPRQQQNIIKNFAFSPRSMKDILLSKQQQSEQQERQREDQELTERIRTRQSRYIQATEMRRFDDFATDKNLDKVEDQKADKEFKKEQLQHNPHQFYQKKKITPINSDQILTAKQNKIIPSSPNPMRKYQSPNRKTPERPVTVGDCITTNQRKVNSQSDNDQKDYLLLLESKRDDNSSCSSIKDKILNNSNEYLNEDDKDKHYNEPQNYLKKSLNAGDNSGANKQFPSLSPRHQARTKTRNMAYSPINRNANNDNNNNYGAANMNINSKYLKNL